MTNYKSKLRKTGTTVSPLGLNSLSVTIERENGKAFYRQKLNGDLIFTGDSYNAISRLKEECCSIEPLDIYRNCQEQVFLQTIINPKKIEWNNELCEAQISPEITDVYVSIYKLWDKKINVLEVPANKKLRQLSRKVVNNEDLTEFRSIVQAKGGTIISEKWHSSSEKAVWFTLINHYGRSLNDIIYYIVKKTFISTEIGYLVPQSIEELSTFLTSDKNICTGRTNICKNSLVFHASDIIDPTNLQNASGVLSSGKINENMAISLKQLLEELKTIFDIEWFIDKSTNKIRLEHSSYVERGGSYTSEVITLDLRDEKYTSLFNNYKYSFKNEFDNITDIDEIRFTLNENVNKSEKSYKAPIIYTNIQYKINEDSFLNCDDFDFGNIRYDNECIDNIEELTRNTLTSQLFYTHYEAIEFADSSIDISKWVLIEVEEEPSPDPNIGIIHGNEIYIVKEAKVERLRVSQSIKNANYSATSLMRDFHRWNRAYPKGYMNFNENAISGTLAAKGILRDMYSVKKTKLLKSFIVPFCCTDPPFDSSGVIVLPNGLKAKVKRATFDFATETLEIYPLTDNPCSIGVKYPEEKEIGQCPEAGTLLRVERYTDTYYMYTGNPCDEDESMRFIWGYNEIENKRYVYADGYCGEYKEEGTSPTAITYYKYNDYSNKISAQQWCELTPEEQNEYLPYLSCV